MKRRVAYALAVLLVALGAAQAGPHHPLIAARSAENPAEPPQLVVSGLWPDSCPPARESVTFDRGLVVRATAPRGSACQPETTHYSIRLDLAGELLNHSVNPVSQTLPVRFFVRLEGDDVYRLMAFRMVSWGTRTVTPESGLWWPAQGSQSGSGPGIAFTIEVQGSELIIVANVYDEDGEPEWLIGSAEIRGSIVSTRLYRLSGGQPMFRDYAPPDGVFDEAHVDIEFRGDSEATAWLSRAVRTGLDSTLLLQPIEIERYRFGYETGQQYWAGKWIVHAGDDFIPIDLVPTAGGARDAATGAEVICDTRAGINACAFRLEGELAVITDTAVNRVRAKARSGSDVVLYRVP